jgi:hypothetical protein
MIVILMRYTQYKNLDTSKRTDLSAYSDQASISSSASEAMSWAVEEGLICGKGNGNLDPSGLATRAEVAAVVSQFATLFPG